MADYYSLLSRAIANLPKTSPPAARKAIYDRARKALNNQLRSLKPPLPESDIVREETALDAAVRRLESEIDPGAAAAPPPPAAPPPLAPPPPPPPARPIAPTAPSELRPPLKPFVAPPKPPAPPPEPARPTAPPVTAAPPPSSAPLAPPVAARSPLPRADEPSAAPPVVEASPKPGLESEAPPVVARSAETKSDGAAPPLKPAAPLNPPPRDADSARPVAPRQDEEEGGSGGLWKWGAVAVVAGLIAAVAFGAYLLRSQHPQDLAIKDAKVTVSTAEPTPAATAGPKINERVDGAATPTPGAEASPEPSASATPSVTTSATPGSAASPSPVATPSPAATTPTTPQPTGAQTPAALGGDRAAMLLASPQDVQKPAVYVGTATWSSPPAAPGQGGGPGIRADIDIPDLKMHATMLMRKNVDPGLPASHTIDLRLAFDDGAPFKGAKDVGVPQMRKDEPAAVTPLLGVRVVINETYFLIGLNRTDTDMQHNLDAIGASGWFDFPMLLPDGRIGKLTFEKGADGEKIVASALAAWK